MLRTQETSLTQRSRPCGSASRPAFPQRAWSQTSDLRPSVLDRDPHLPPLTLDLELQITWSTL